MASDLLILLMNTKVPRTYPPEVGAKGSMIDEGSTEKNVDRLFGLIADVL